MPSRTSTSIAPSPWRERASTIGNESTAIRRGPHALVGSSHLGVRRWKPGVGLRRLRYDGGMTSRSPDSLSAAELRRRRARARRLARDVGFVGSVEYRHVASQSGGAQYGRGVGDRGDVLMAAGAGPDRDALIAKATAEVLAGGGRPEAAVRLVVELWGELGSLLS